MALPALIKVRIRASVWSVGEWLYLTVSTSEETSDNLIESGAFVSGPRAPYTNPFTYQTSILPSMDDPVDEEFVFAVPSMGGGDSLVNAYMACYNSGSESYMPLVIDYYLSFDGTTFELAGSGVDGEYVPLVVGPPEPFWTDYVKTRESSA